MAKKLEFFLVKDYEVYFNKNRRSLGGDLVIRDTGHGWIPGDIIPSAALNEDGQRFCKILKTLLESGCAPSSAANETEGSSGPKLLKLQSPESWGLRAVLCLKTPNSGDSRYWKREWVQVTGEEGGGNFLERLKSVLERYKLEVELKVEISGLQFIGANGKATNWTIQQLCTDRVGITELSSPGDRLPDNTFCETSAGAALFSSGNWNKEWWGKEGSSHVGNCNFTIKAVIYGNWQSLLSNGHEALLQWRDSVVVIETENEEEFYCHRSIISEKSPVFAGMFRMDSGFEGRIVIKDLSKAGVQAFVDYMYFRCLKAPMENPIIALELLEAAYRYEVADLEPAIVQLLKNKSHEWLGIDATLEFFTSIRDFPGNTDKSITITALNVLKRNCAIFRESATDLVLSDPVATREVLKHMLDKGLEARGIKLLFKWQ